MKTQDALRYAQSKDLDLVEVAADAKPPVCRVLDYSKYKYEQNQKQKQARKHQTQINVREIKFRPKIAQHDYDTKKGHVERFLKARDKVKVTIMFRGREMAHPERGEMILNRLAEDLGELATIEQRPQQDGRNMTMMLAPARAIAEDEETAAAEAASEEAALHAAQAAAEARRLSAAGRDQPGPDLAGDAATPAPPHRPQASDAPSASKAAASYTVRPCLAAYSARSPVSSGANAWRGAASASALPEPCGGPGTAR